MNRLNHLKEEFLAKAVCALEYIKRVQEIHPDLFVCKDRHNLLVVVELLGVYNASLVLADEKPMCSYIDGTEEDDLPEGSIQRCIFGCHETKPYGFVVMAGCPIHDD